MRYKIIRFYKQDGKKPKVLRVGLTLEQVKKHVDNPETSSSTAKTPMAKYHTEQHGEWFDGYDEE